MIEILGLVSMGIIAIVMAGQWVSSRGRKGSENSVQQSFAILDQVLEDAKERILREEEALAVGRRLVEQGDETIALLKSIKDSLEHRSLKN